MTAPELTEILRDAQEKLFEAIELLEQYVQATDDKAAEAYIVDHLKIMASRDHGFLSRDTNIDDLIAAVEADKEDGCYPE